MIDQELERRINEIYRRLDAQKLLVTQNKWWGYKSAHQLNITNATWTQVLLDTTYSPMTCVSGLSSNGYPVIERGIYLAIGKTVWSGMVAGERCMTAIYLNAALHDVDGANADNNGLGYSRCVTLIPADVGDVIKLYCYHNDGTNNPDLTCTSQAETSLKIHLLSRQCK